MLTLLWHARKTDYSNKNQSNAIARLQGISMPNCSTIARMQGIQTIPQIAVQNSLQSSGMKCVKHVTHLDSESKFLQLMFSQR